MKKFKTLLLSVLALGACMTANAQATTSDYEYYPHAFVQVQGGVNTVYADMQDFPKLLNPTFSLGAGGWFSPIYGMRLHANAYETKGGFAFPDESHKFKYVNADVDAMLNVTNLFRKNKQALVNVILIGGVGLTDFFGKEDPILSQPGAVGPEQKAYNKGLVANAKAGAALDFNVSKHWNIGLEGLCYFIGDELGYKTNNKSDVMLTAQLSLTYKFGFKKKPAPAPAPEPVIVEEPAPAPAPAPVVVEKKEEPLKETIFYQIRMSDLDHANDILTKVVNWCNEYPAKKINVSGYADKGTGNAKVNKKYAYLRATKVADALRERGIDADRIVVESFGDTVQPFSANDDNRCTIIVGE